jgi:signal transduction histidine kinase
VEICYNRQRHYHLVRYCQVSVEYNGPSIPDDLKGKIFSRKPKGTERLKGMGLELYLVKSLVDSYDSKIWVENWIIGDDSIRQESVDAGATVFLKKSSLTLR